MEDLAGTGLSLESKRNSKRRSYQVDVDCCLSISSLVTGDVNMTKPQMSSCAVVSCFGAVGRPHSRISW